MILDRLGDLTLSDNQSGLRGKLGLVCHMALPV